MESARSVTKQTLREAAQSLRGILFRSDSRGAWSPFRSDSMQDTLRQTARSLLRLRAESTHVRPHRIHSCQVRSAEPIFHPSGQCPVAKSQPARAANGPRKLNLACVDRVADCIAKRLNLLRKPPTCSVCLRFRWLAAQMKPCVAR